MKCQNCGSKVNKKQKFCSKCGATISNNASAKYIIIICILIVLVLFAIGIIIYQYVNYSSSMSRLTETEKIMDDYDDNNEGEEENDDDNSSIDIDLISEDTPGLIWDRFSDEILKAAESQITQFDRYIDLTKNEKKEDIIVKCGDAFINKILAGNSHDKGNAVYAIYTVPVEVETSKRKDTIYVYECLKIKDSTIANNELSLGKIENIDCFEAVDLLEESLNTITEYEFHEVQYNEYPEKCNPNVDYLSAYEEFYNENSLLYDNYYAQYDLIPKYRLIYIDDDDVPEAVVGYTYPSYGDTFWGQIYTYSNGKVSCVTEYSYELSMVYLEREGIIYKDGTGGEECFSVVYSFENGELVFDSGCSIYSNMGDWSNISYYKLLNDDDVWDRSNPISEDEYNRIYQEYEEKIINKGVDIVYELELYDSFAEAYEHLE